MGFDQRVFFWINGWPDGIEFLRFFSVGFNWPVVKVLLGLFVIAMLAAGPKTRIAVLLALAAVALANPLTDLWKHLLPQHRPFQPEALGALVHLRVGAANSAGTASAHTANMTAVATVMTARLKWWGSPWIAVALFTAISRVYVGAHFPWQVCLGALCGLAASGLVLQAWRTWERRREAKDGTAAA